MAMPWQLKVGLYNKKKSGRTEQRPLAETLPHINVNDLDVPRDYKTYIAPNISMRYPHINTMKISHFMVSFAHSDRVQTFRFKSIKTGFGGNYSPRYAFVCECGRSTTKLYFRHQHLGCRACFNLTYASRVLNKDNRPRLQAIRLNNFTQLKSGMHRHTKQRLQARMPRTTKPLHLTNKRITDNAKLPQSNYCTRGAAHWL
jgi:hypothetical protein